MILPHLRNCLVVATLVAAVVALAVLVVALLAVHQAVEEWGDAGRQTKELVRFMNEDPRGIKGLMANANVILIQVGLATDSWRRVSQSQEAYWRETERKTSVLVDRANDLMERGNRAADGLDRLLRRTDDSLNNEAFPRFNVVLEEAAEAVREGQRSVRVLTATSEEAIGSANRVLLSTNDLLLNPELAAAFRQLHRTSLHMANSSANVDEGTGYIRDMLRPTSRSFWSGVAGNLMSAATPVLFRLFIPARSWVTNTPTVRVEEAEKD